MATGEDMVSLALTRVGEEYENVQVPKNNANWHGPWDCAEFMSWLVFQCGGFLYGCIENNAPPASADAYTGAWRRDGNLLGKQVSVEQAAAIVGAFVLRYPPSSGKMGHVAICDGRGGTVEAKSHKEDVVTDVVHGRRWDVGILVPGISYDESVPPLSLTPPGKVVRIGAHNNPAIVREIQNALLAAGINPGPIDGKYGPKTAAAVAAFQQLKGLVVDGEVGPKTAGKLRIHL